MKSTLRHDGPGDPTFGQSYRSRPRYTGLAYLGLGLSLLVSLLGCTGTPASPTLGPFLSSASPAAAAVGAGVALTGQNFTATANHIKIGVGYVHNLSSLDGKTIFFNVPNALDVCAPGQQVCPALVVVLSPGDYKMSVINDRGTSNEISFTVTAR